MSEVQLQAQRRTLGRSNARVLRRNSQVPGIYYYHGEDSIAIQVTELDLRPLIYTKESHIVALNIEGAGVKTCVLKDISFDPVTDRPVHFDLQGVSADEAIRVEVPISIIGQAAGQRNGGLVQIVMHRLEVECVPSSLPEHVEVDITNLEIGDSIHVSDLSIPGVDIISPEDATIVSVVQPRVEVEPVPGAEPTSAEPEVIARGKEKSED